MSYRVFLNIFFIFSLIFLPWWATFVVALIMSGLIDRCYELPILGALYDVTFSVGQGGFLAYSGTIVGVLFLIISLFIKPRLVNVQQLNRRFQISNQ